MLFLCKLVNAKNCKITANSYTAGWRSMNNVKGISIKLFKRLNVVFPPGWFVVCFLFFERKKKKTKIFSEIFKKYSDDFYFGKR